MTTPETGPAAAAPRSPVRRKRSPRKPGSAPRRRRSPSRRKPAASSRIDEILKALAKRAEAARRKISEASDEGARAARRAVGQSAAASKKAADRVAREWNKLDTPRKVELVAALLSALAAASTPIVARRRKR
jgi:hypothetical protein